MRRRTLHVLQSNMTGGSITVNFRVRATTAKGFWGVAYANLFLTNKTAAGDDDDGFQEMHLPVVRTSGINGGVRDVVPEWSLGDEPMKTQPFSDDASLFGNGIWCANSAWGNQVGFAFECKVTARCLARSRSTAKLRLELCHIAGGFEARALSATVDIWDPSEECWEPVGGRRFEDGKPKTRLDDIDASAALPIIRDLLRNTRAPTSNGQAATSGTEALRAQRQNLTGVSSQELMETATAAYAELMSRTQTAAREHNSTVDAESVSDPEVMDTGDNDDQNSDRVPENGTCLICTEARADMACVPCGHMCVCEGCFGTMPAANRARCEMCRATVDSRMRIFAGGFQG